MRLVKYIIFLFFLQFHSACSIASVRDGEQSIEKRFSNTFLKSKNSKNSVLLVHSDTLHLHKKMGLGFIDYQVKTNPTHADQPFHVASIGKLFTSVLIYQLIEEGKISLKDPISKFLNSELLKNLFVINRVDYQNKVLVSHLLSHLSGINDYFESVDKNERSVLQEIHKEPNHFWKPIELIDFTRKYQKARGIPGEKFHYSDTGYILLGLIIEKLTNKKYESVLQEKILKPLGMNNTYMHLRSKPIKPSKYELSTIMLGDLDVTAFKSVSADWTGGGIISTTEDLLLFHNALVKGKLISMNSYNSMKGNQKFHDGIYYGNGLMSIKYGDMSILMPDMPILYGHSGLLSTLLFYSPDLDTHIIANFGSTDDIEKSFEMMFWILKDVSEIQIEKK